MSDEDEEPEVAESETAEVEAAEVAEAVVVRDELAEIRSQEARRKLRDQLQSEIDAFLRSGGKIEQVAPNVSAQDQAPAEAAIERAT